MIDTPTIDWAALSPYLALLAGVGVIMLVAPFLPGRLRNGFGAIIAVLCLAGAAAAAITLFTLDDTGSGIVADALRRTGWPTSARSSLLRRPRRGAHGPAGD